MLTSSAAESPDTTTGRACVRRLQHSSLYFRVYKILILPVLSTVLCLHIYSTSSCCFNGFARYTCDMKKNFLSYAGFLPIHLVSLVFKGVMF